MNNKIDWEKLSFEMISKVGLCKSEAIEAIQEAKKGLFDKANKKMSLANDLMAEASHMHFDVIQKEARGESLQFKVLFMHAEDQLMTTQNLLLMANEIIELHENISKWKS